MNDLIWLYRQNGILAIHVIGALVALISPEDVLHRFAWIGEVIYGLSAVFPIIRNFSSESSFPEVMALQAGLMMVASPYCVYLWMEWPGRQINKIDILNRAKAGLLNMIALHAIAILLLVSAFVYLFLVNGSDFFIAPFKSSRVALALFGPVLFSLVPAGFVVTISLLFSVIKQYWKGN